MTEIVRSLLRPDWPRSLRQWIVSDRGFHLLELATQISRERQVKIRKVGQITAEEKDRLSRYFGVSEESFMDALEAAREHRHSLASLSRRVPLTRKPRPEAV